MTQQLLCQLLPWLDSSVDLITVVSLLHPPQEPAFSLTHAATL